MIDSFFPSQVCSKTSKGKKHDSTCFASKAHPKASIRVPNYKAKTQLL
jgi:hypothetical protein